jgi:hypothetical protein
MRAEHFVDPEPDTIFLGAMSLRQYLTGAGLIWPIRLRELLAELEYVAFLESYGCGSASPTVMTHS